MIESGCRNRNKIGLLYYYLHYPIFALILFFLPASQAKADPILVETGAITGHSCEILIAGLALEAVILAWFIKKPFFKALHITILANLITGFVGLVAWLLVQINGDTAFALGPAFLFAILIEAPIISVMVIDVPCLKVIKGVTFANLASLILGLLFLLPVVLPAPQPAPEDDLELSRGVAEIRVAVDEYYDMCKAYPSSLTGGRKDINPNKNTDPLIASGILESYPENPYADSLRSLRFNPVYMIFGIGDPVIPVKYSSPSNAWEFRWFPAISNDSRFGDPDGSILCANGLSDRNFIETQNWTFYHMNGADIIPGCIFYKSYDFDCDGKPDDYILGAYGWPTGIGTTVADIIDGSTGEICLCLQQDGIIKPGQPDGIPEPIAALYIAGGQPACR